MNKKLLLHIRAAAIQGILIAGIASSSFAAAGTAGAQFLKLGAGARAAAMGDSYSSVADDVTATYWNPAGLAQIESPEVSFMQNSFLLDTNYQFLGAALPLGDRAIGFSISLMDFGDIERYNAQNQKDGSFDAGSFAGNLTWSTPIRENLTLGLTGKFIQESIENEKASAFAADLGFLYKRDLLSLSLSAHHMGSQLKFVEEKEDLPQTFRAGASYRFLNEKLLTTLDFSKPKDNDTTIHLGTEYKVFSLLSIRGGYYTTPGNQLDIDGSTGLTGGFGINYSRFSFDYAFVPFGDLDNTHRFSFLVRFNQK